jgi:hypothetical protein
MLLLHTLYKQLTVRGVLFNQRPSLDQPIAAFFRSISLRNEEALQDTLRLLTLWFKYGSHDEVSHAMGNGFTAVEVDTWLEVIPQVFIYFIVFTNADYMLDYCQDSNASCQYPTKYQQPSSRSWKTSSTSTDIPPYRGFQVL